MSVICLHTLIMYRIPQKMPVMNDMFLQLKCSLVTILKNSFRIHYLVRL